ncbi:MAG: iron exporter MbfA [Hyphomicrobium sp.]
MSIQSLRSLFSRSKRRFADLSDKEILALAISSEEEDSRIYAAFASNLKNDYADSAAIFEGMAAEEDQHRRSLTDWYQRLYGDAIIPLTREQVADFYPRNPVWLIENLGLERIRQEVFEMERESQKFYELAAQKAKNPETRKLLDYLGRAETAHETIAEKLTARHLSDEKRAREDLAFHRQFILTWIQPGLAGLMDGSVSTLAPIFATAFATQNPSTTFLVGLSASVGAGISMGFTEAAHDDGKISGRGAPWKRGLASGVMTMIGGLGHALPYLIPNFWTATVLALVVVFIELWAIVWIQNRYMETPFLRATFQVVLGGALVLAAGIVIGSA